MREGALALVGRLADELGQAGIRYVHWKSNEALARSLSGDNDLDLLIDSADRFDFGALLARLGFVQASAPRDHRTPGIASFYGHDRATGRIVHVHAHYRLELGYDLLKNFRLPIERAMLDGARDGGGLPVPEPELEYLVFVVRMVLKRRLLRWMLADPNPRIWTATLFGAGHPPLAGSEKREWDDFQGRVDRARVDALREQLVPELSADLFATCEQSLRADAGRFAWLAPGWRLGAALRRYRRAPLWRSVALAAGRRAAEIAADKLRRPPANRRLLGTGRVIAFVGGDGSGKTTNVEALHDWLSSDLDTRVFHLGKPPWGPVRQGARLLGKAIRLAMGGKREHEVPVLQAVSHVLHARARWQSTREVGALAKRGTLVVCDRYPLPALRFAESAEIHKMPSASAALRWLARAEESYYARIPAPDQIVVLRIDPERAIARKPEDQADYIRPRLEEIWTADWDAVGASVVDTSQPLDDVLARVRELVWSALPSWSPLGEVAGLAGSGKSSVIRALATAPSDSSPIDSWPEVEVRQHPWRLLRNALALTRFAGSRVPLEQLKLMLVVGVWMDVWESRIEARALPHPALLDQGPLFELAYIAAHDSSHREHGGYRAWLERSAERCARLLDVAIFLEADDTLLMERIRGRKKDHEVKAWTDAETAAFFANFRDSFDRVVLDAHGDERLSVRRIDTARSRPGAIAAEVRALLAPGARAS